MRPVRVEPTLPLRCCWQLVRLWQTALVPSACIPAAVLAQLGVWRWRVLLRPRHWPGFVPGHEQTTARHFPLARLWHLWALCVSLA